MTPISRSSRLAQNVDAMYRERQQVFHAPPEEPLEPTIVHPPPSPPPPQQYHPPASLASRYDDIEHVKSTPTVTVFDGPTIAPGLRLCMLGLGLVIVILIALSISVIVSSQHRSHSLKLGQVSNQASLISQTNYFMAQSAGLEKTQATLVGYQLRLPEQVQKQYTLPSENESIPGLVLEREQFRNFLLCCFSNSDNMWVCSNGGSYESPSFDAKLKHVGTSVQLVVNVHSIHLSGAICMLEVGLLS